MLHKLSFLLFITIGGFTIQAQILINEFSAAHYSHTQDNYNEYEDWIELYNTGSTSIDLGGYYLSDKESKPKKWTFPAGVSIAAGGHLLVWASSRDEFITGNIHTNFKITQTKFSEVVVLSDPSGALLDIYYVDSANQSNHSFARIGDGGTEWGVALDPTPGSSNVNVKQKYTPTPSMSIDAGFYQGSINVSLNTSDPNATIYYTLDGTDPDDNSAVYSSTLNISQTSVLRAIAYSSDTDVPKSFVVTNTYFIDANHNIPVISISGSLIDDLINGNNWIEPRGHFEMFDQSNNLIDEAFGEYNKHGNDSWAYAQRGIDYITRDQFGYNYTIQHPVFPNKTRDKYQRTDFEGCSQR